MTKTFKMLALLAIAGILLLGLPALALSAHRNHTVYVSIVSVNGGSVISIGGVFADRADATKFNKALSKQPLPTGVTDRIAYIALSTFEHRSER